MLVGPQWSYIPSPTIPMVKKYYFLIDTQKEANNFMWHAHTFMGSDDKV